MRGIYFAASLAAVFLSSAILGRAQCSAPNAGYTWISVPEPDATPPFQNGVMNVGIWYPTADTPSSYTYNSGNSGNTINPPASGTVALNGAVSSCAKHPVLLFSHGDGGCGTQSVFFTEQAARMGYIVIAPDSTDATCSVTGVPYTKPSPAPNYLDPSSWTDQTEINRLHDIENALLAVHALSSYSPSMDLSRIAVSGHSLGGYTTFGIIGGWSSWLTNWQTTMTNAGIGEASVEAAVLLSPVINPYTYQTPSTVPQVTVPMMFQGGTKDTGVTPWVMGVPPDTHDSGAYAESTAPKFFMELQDAGHLDFTNLVCAGVSVETCLTTVPMAAAIDNYAFAFLNYQLNYNPLQQSQAILWNAGEAGVVPNFWRNQPANALSDASFAVGSPLSPETIGALFGEGMSTSATASPSAAWPTTLAGATVTVTDSQGIARNSMLSYASPGQINFVVPSGTAPGTATVTVSTPASTSVTAPSKGTLPPSVTAGVVASGTIAVDGVSPGIFTLNSANLAAAFVDYVSGPLQVTVGDFQLVNGALVPAAINLSQGANGTILELYGTGIRHAGTGSVQVTFNGVAGSGVVFAAQQQFPGLDQVNVYIPNDPAVHGNVLVQLTAGGVKANPVYISVM